MNLSDNQQTFLALLRAGLWENSGSMESWNQGVTEAVDWGKVCQLAAEQSVLGLVLAGIERYKNLNFDLHLDQKQLLQWIGEVQMIEQQNLAMNKFVAQLIERLRKEDIYALLVKGQGIAQCYEKPLWRTCGDVDLLLDDDNYEKAKVLLIPLADEVEDEDPVKKHQALIIKGFDIELHGKMPFALSRKADKVIDSVIDDSLKQGGARVWSYKNSDIYLPDADNDVIIVFTHFLHHFFIEGVGLRQVCDWCWLLWTYRDSLNHGLLESRIREMGLMSEWQVFAALAVEYLGMPAEAMPFYDSRFTVKGERVLERILKSGNFGHNNDLSYRAKYSGMRYKIVALWRRLMDFIGLSQVFPLDAPKFFVTYVFGKV